MKLYVGLIAMVVCVSGCAYSVMPEQDKKVVVSVSDAAVIDSDTPNVGPESNDAGSDVLFWKIPDANGYAPTYTCLASSDDQNGMYWYLECDTPDPSLCTLKNCKTQGDAPVCFNGVCIQN